MAKPKKTANQILQIAILFVLSVGIVVGLLLVKQNQDIRKQAYTKPRTNPATMLETGKAINVDENWDLLIYAQPRSPAPVKLAQVATYKGTDPVEVRFRNTATPDINVQMRIEEDNIDGGNHVNENVNYLFIQPGLIYNSSNQQIGEAYNTTANIGYGLYKMHGFYENPNTQLYPSFPLAFTQITSNNTVVPLITRTHINQLEINDQYIQFAIDNWSEQNPQSAAEDVSVLILQPGVHTLWDGSIIEVGSTPVANSRQNGSDFVTVGLTANFTVDPYVFTKIISYNETDSVITRVQSATTTSFKVGIADSLHEADNEGNQRAHITEDVAWIAIQPAVNSRMMKVNSTQIKK